MNGVREMTRERKIRFAPTIHNGIVQVCSLHDYSISEKKRCWYSGKELRKIRVRYKKNVRRLESGKKCKKGSSYRGLESWTKEGVLELDKEVFACIDAVLDEQQVQWQSGADDNDHIATLSREISKRSIAQAMHLAKGDEREARNVYIDMELGSKKALDFAVTVLDEDCTSICSKQSLDGTEPDSSFSSISTESDELDEHCTSVCSNQSQDGTEPNSSFSSISTESDGLFSISDNAVVGENRKSRKHRKKRHGRGRKDRSSAAQPSEDSFQGYLAQEVSKPVTYTGSHGSHGTLWV
jgi:hypothetical protein